MRNVKSLCYINHMGILEKISSPQDLQQLTHNDLSLLAEELRSRIIKTVAGCGGHLGSNLGTVELTIAMLRSFDLPADRVVWDVGHQSYAFKLLTGQQKEFDELRKFGGCCGFPVRNNSDFECYSAGHAGVAISAALGMCQAQAPGSKERVVAVVGDGALGSGVALEGLNQVREHGKRLVIILNDNKMAISRNVGSISRALNRMMTSYRYLWIKNTAKAIINLLPRSRSITHHVSRIEDAAKILLLPGGIFDEMGIRYLGPINGHDIAAMERTFKSVQRDDRPVLIHVVTEKGRGYAPAVAEPERFHGIGKFDITSGKPLSEPTKGFSHAFGEAACALAEKNPDLTAVVAAMTGGVGLDNFASRFPERFYDVGMAEAHAVSFSSGLAAAGKPVICAIYATFMQRSLDNIFHDVCLMKLPVIFALDRAGLVEDGPTHHGIYDLGFLLTMPNLTIMQPAYEAEISDMLALAIKLQSPAVIRYPRGNSGVSKIAEFPKIPLEYGKAAVVREGSDLAIYAVGAEVVRALQIAEILQQTYQLNARIVNVRFLKPFDKTLLQKDLQQMPVFTLEDHVVDCGLGSLAAAAAAEMPEKTARKLTVLGIPGNTLPAFGAVECLRKSLELDVPTLAEKIARSCRSS